MKPRVLIVEDEAALVTMLRYNLECEGFEVSEATDGEEALLQIAVRRPDIVLLDWMLPAVSGLEVCRQIRRMPQTRSLPVIILTARGEETDRVRGLDSGADDYIVKPFSPGELVARLRAVIRRAQPGAAAETLCFADLEMDLAAHRVARAGKPIHLGPTEFRLLRYLLQHPRRVFSREQLLDQVWGHDVYVETRTVDVHIRRLRKALNAGGARDILRTVRAAGYSVDYSDSQTPGPTRTSPAALPAALKDVAEAGGPNGNADVERPAAAPLSVDKTGAGDRAAGARRSGEFSE